VHGWSPRSGRALGVPVLRNRLAHATESSSTAPALRLRLVRDLSKHSQVGAAPQDNVAATRPHKTPTHQRNYTPRAQISQPPS
jgi:hypothetical protein